ncbi:MAG: hypothetical protein HC792_04035 [Acaryochloridaceae cyanobacterium CSU_5_19]|nr:hypothetical protein [Acaryochloridaceae cyanobacterium CSU_5_19]
MGLADSEAYWEVNLSPRGDWNIYHLQGYRQGLQAEMAIKTLPLVVNAAPLGSPQPGFELQAVLNGATCLRWINRSIWGSRQSFKTKKEP